MPRPAPHLSWSATCRAPNATLFWVHTVDQTPPVFVNGTPALGSASGVQAEILLAMSEPGNVTYAVLPQARPWRFRVGQGLGGAIAWAKGRGEGPTSQGVLHVMFSKGKRRYLMLA